MSTAARRGRRLALLPVLWLGKVLLVLARLRGGGGSAFPGLVVERVWPRLLTAQLEQLSGGCILVTGTNGKTTSVKMLTSLLEHGGQQVVTNRSGSNMVRGLLSTVVEQSSWNGRLPGDLAVFEVDEPNIPAVAHLVDPDVLVVLNLHRDQLDRYGELERTAELVGAGVPLARTVVLNADDPLVARLAIGATASTSVRWFGVSSELRQRLPDDAHLLVGSADEPAAVPFEQLEVGVLAATERDDGTQDLDLRIGSDEHSAHLPLPGVYNATNLAAVLVAVASVGRSASDALGALSALTPAFGRGERIEVGDRTVVVQLVKNPSSFTQVIRTQLAHGADRDLLIAINDNFADGRDISWLWDVDFEALVGRNDRIMATGTRGTDLAVRLKYAELTAEVTSDPGEALDRFVAALGPGGTGVIVPTYTAMLDLRQRLGRVAQVDGFWT